MSCTAMLEAVYDNTDISHEEVTTLDPSWDQVQAAIHRLDKFRFSSVWLFAGDNHDDPMEDCMQVMGAMGCTGCQ